MIESCQENAEKLINDLDLHVLVHTAFGKTMLKINYLEMQWPIGHCV